MSTSPLLLTTAPHTPLRFLLRDALRADRDPLREWLLRDPVAHLQHLAWLDTSLLHTNPRARLLLADAGNNPEPLLGACLLLGERMAVPATPFPQVARAFGDRLRRERVALEHITGEDTAVEALWEGYAPGDAPRLNQRQRAYLLHTPPHTASHTDTPLRPATLDDLDPLFIASAALYQEETLSDPATTAPHAFRHMIRERILQRQSWVWTDDGGVRFKAELALHTPLGALLSGVYTRPDARRQGTANAALQHLIHDLLPSTARLILHVNADNAPARTLYEALGFRYTCPWRTLFVS